MTYVGVEFDNDGGLALIHSAWLTPLKRNVFWPPSSTQTSFKKLLRSGKEPPEDGSWKLHKVQRLFFQTGS